MFHGLRRVLRARVHVVVHLAGHARDRLLHHLLIVRQAVVHGDAAIQIALRPDRPLPDRLLFVRQAAKTQFLEARCSKAEKRSRDLLRQFRAGNQQRAVDRLPGLDRLLHERLRGVRRGQVHQEIRRRVGSARRSS